MTDVNYKIKKNLLNLKNVTKKDSTEDNGENKLNKNESNENKANIQTTLIGQDKNKSPKALTGAQVVGEVFQIKQRIYNDQQVTEAAKKLRT